MTAAEQARVFAAMAVCGAAAGAGRDALTLVFRGGWAHVLDLLTGAGAAAGMIAAALCLRTEVFRWYTFAGVLAGFAVYRLTIGTIVRDITRRVRLFVKKRKNMNKKAAGVAGK